jgi:molybdate transport system substrate-binding protein
MPRPRLALVLAASLLLAALSPRPATAEELVVSAAASLTSALTDVKKAFEAEHPGLTVFVNFAASGPLLQQIEAGAPVDVFAPADQVTMDRAARDGLIDPATRVDFTANDLMLTVPADENAVTCVADLGGDKVGKVALGEPDAVPAGSYTKQVLDGLGLWEKLSPKMVYGLSVKQALDYVALGEVDAAFVYATDARMAQKRVRVVAALSGHAPIVYPAAMLAACPRKEAAKAFIDFLHGPKGQEILASYGFKAPAAAK